MIKCKCCGKSKLDSLECKGIDYYSCSECHLIWKNDSHIVEPDAEEARYATHNNTRENEGYVKWLNGFLDKAVHPFISGGLMLDYGCGPGPVLAELLSEKGFRTEVYDLYFQKVLPKKENQFDLITCTEVIEHVSDLNHLFSDFNGLLKKDGILSLMTQYHKGLDAICDWWYVRDETHITFFDETTFENLAKIHGYEILHSDGKSICVMKREEI